MPKLETLPREPRQHIFSYAFDDAASQDHKLHAKIEKYL